MTAAIVKDTPFAYRTETFAHPRDLDHHWKLVHLRIMHNGYWSGCSENRGKGHYCLAKLRIHQSETHGFARVSSVLVFYLRPETKQ